MTYMGRRQAQLHSCPVCVPYTYVCKSLLQQALPALYLLALQLQPASSTAIFNHFVFSKSRKTAQDGKANFKSPKLPSGTILTFLNADKGFTKDRDDIHSLKQNAPCCWPLLPLVG